jgi:hypothetical protein
LNSNLAQATFWFLLETIRSQEFSCDVGKEIATATVGKELSSRFDIKKLMDYAETLRMYVSVMMLRTTRHETKVKDMIVPVGQKVVVCNYSEHMNERLWNSDQSQDAPPVTTFWGRHFLTYPTAKTGDTHDEDNKPRFSTEGLNSTWFPFGIGNEFVLEDNSRSTKYS